MGVSYSSTDTKSQQQQQQQERDIQYLGNRFPFGDLELIRLYQAYHHYQQQQEEERSSSSSSFLTDYAVQCTVKAPTREALEDVRQERYVLVQIVEQHILPSHFSTNLEQRIFSVGLGQQQQHNTTSYSSTTTTPTTTMDEFTRMARLEKFFDGASRVGRKGSREALKVMFEICCVPTTKDTFVLATTNTNNNSPPSSQPSYTSASTSASTTEPLAYAKDLLHMAHRLTLASAFMEAASKKKKKDKNNTTTMTSNNNNEANVVVKHDDDPQDNSENEFVGANMTEFIPNNNNHDDDDEEYLNAFIECLVQYARYRRLRDSAYGTLEAWEERALEAKQVSIMDWYEWSETVAPLIPSTLSTFMHVIFFPELPYPPSRTAIAMPVLLQDSVFVGGQSTTSSSSSPMLFTFCSMSQGLGGPWYRLYTSASDGLSFNRLQNALLGYGGPTLFLIQAVTTKEDQDPKTGKRIKNIFGAYTSAPWKESKDFYGNSDCFLFQLLPETRVYRPSSSSSSTSSRNPPHYMYCNSEARSRGYDQQAHGIGFGGTVTNPRLFLDESFDQCHAASNDLTFEHGPLLASNNRNGNDPFGSTTSTSLSTPSKYFDIDQLEVWGVGGSNDIVEAALGARAKQRDIRAANLQKARKVDKAAFLDDFRSGLIESKAFQYKDQIRGRADAMIDDKHKNAYVYEK